MTTVMDNAMDTAKDALGGAKGAAEDAAVAAKSKAGEAAKMIKKAASFLRQFDVDDVLSLIGRRPRLRVFEAVALISGGAILGAGIVFLTTPITGKDARKHISTFLEALGGRVEEAAKTVEHKAEGIAGEVKEKVGEAIKDVKEKASEIAKEGHTEVAGMAGRGGTSERNAPTAAENVSGQPDESSDEGKARRRNNQTIRVS